MGVCDASPHIPDDYTNLDAKDPVRTFCETMHKLPRNDGLQNDIFWALHEMHRRHAKSQHDKISGLLYLFNQNANTLPIYDADDREGVAWQRFVEVLPSNVRAEIFFFFPGPRSGREDGPLWCPSWRQLIRCSERLPKSTHKATRSVEFDRKFGYWIERITIKCFVACFSQSSAPGGEGRVGRIKLETEREPWLSLRAVAEHDQDIPHGVYLLLMAGEGEGNTRWYSDDSSENLDDLDDRYDLKSEAYEEESGPDYDRCVLGRLRGGFFEKMTVIKIEKPSNSREWSDLEVVSWRGTVRLA